MSVYFLAVDLYIHQVWVGIRDFCALQKEMYDDATLDSALPSGCYKQIQLMVKISLGYFGCL